MVKSNDNSSYKRGQELLDQGLYKEAIEQFDAAIAEQPGSWESLELQRFCFSEAEQIHRSGRMFRQGFGP